jgi:hypothetical protein
MASGSNATTVFADEWNGSTWTLLTLPQPGSESLLFAVDCLSTTYCMAVGETGLDATMAEQWDGSSWTIVPTPPANSTNDRLYLLSVSCVSATDCWGVGYLNLEPLAEHFDGSAWTVDPSLPVLSDGGLLNSVSCASTTFCEAVGGSGIDSTGDLTPFIETWDGSAWTTASSPVAPNPGQSNDLYGVDCYSAATCVAVGAGPGVSVLDYDGGQWSIAPGPSPAPGQTGVLLSSVSCVADWDCVADDSYGSQLSFVSTPVSSAVAPNATITSPAPGGVYGLNQVITTAFNCTEGSGGPGIATCADSNGSTSPGTLDTSTYGQHTYSVTATSTDGLTATSSITYTVVSPPTASISAPASGGTYVQNEVVPTGFTCSEGNSGPGLASCVDSSGSTSPGVLDTSTVGTFAYSVTATSKDGLSDTATVTYTVEASTTTTLSASTNPVHTRRTVTYTATVSPVPSGGWVAFTDGGTTIPSCGSVSLSSATGQAVCTVTYSSKGNHSIIATYGGAPFWQTSTSATLSEQVK